VPTDKDYARLLAFRTRLRPFDHWSTAAAAEHGLSHAQHQLMLAIRGHRDGDGPTIGEAAAYLLVKPHTASELAGRVEALGLIERVRDTKAHLEELRRLAPLLGEI
jgi:DNA-binding MarR family transcriptional regulator